MRQHCGELDTILYIYMYHNLMAFFTYMNVLDLFVLILYMYMYIYVNYVSQVLAA